MWQRLKIGLMFLLLGFCVSAFQPPPSAPSGPLCSVVTQIDLQCSYESYRLQRRYTSEESLHAVLTYLRLLHPKPCGNADPEQFAGERYRIRIQFSTGPDKVYYQHSDRFLSVDRQLWQAIDRAIAGTLHDLMVAIPSDP